MAGIDSSELNTLRVDLGGAGARAMALTRAVVAKTAADIVADAKAFAPVDTGNLRSSIGHSGLSSPARGGTVEVEIGPTAAYGHHVEFGTSRKGPAAFMGPALDRRTPDFIAAMEQVGEQAL